jgi:hypothetical protein
VAAAVALARSHGLADLPRWLAAIDATVGGDVLGAAGTLPSTPPDSTAEGG